jgi:glycosyltransferase involved in cell wall biosynthesis
MAKISIALLTHNEALPFRWLMQSLSPALSVLDEIVVVDDFSDPDCVETIRGFEDKVPLRFYQRALRKNFAKQRNYMKSLCRGELIFFLDPDELPSERLLMGLPKILEMMERLDIDACTLPRINILHDSDQPVHPSELNLADSTHKVLWEDQIRILRNLPRLYWTMHLNEYLTGMRRCYRFPRLLDYALLHPKTVNSAAKQRLFYKSIKMRHVSRVKNSIFKRVPWRRRIEWIAADVPI